MESQTKLNSGNGIDTLDLPYPKKKYLNKKEIMYLPQQTPELYAKVEVYKNHHRELKTRARNWERINKKQAKQDLYAWDLISLMVDSLNIPKPRRKVGRPPADPSDQLKFAILKVYNKSSFRRTYSFNSIYANSGYTKSHLKRTSINNVFTEAKFKPYLEEIYRRLADLLIPYENTFAIDASGFSTRYNSRWIKVKFDFQKHKDYKKLHIVCGTFTNIITDVKITPATANDAPHLIELLDSTNSRFRIKRFCADAGYLSRENVQAIEDIKARSFIMPKKNSSRRAMGYRAWHRMIRMWQEYPERFKKEYHLRSNVETCFSMMKTTIMDGIMSKTDVSQENELLIRVICHNLAVIIDAIFRWDVDPYSFAKGG